uniref:Phytosulfokine n=1 Tax=Kalanchoe fedtschenkoi TaxID=63787 RepID=A0A7N0TNS7_KALFE
MSKPSAASLLVLFLLACSALTQAARPAPVLEPQQLGFDQGAAGAGENIMNGTTVMAAAGAEDDVCDGVGEDECRMMRRELAAHLDYIYTQKKKN